MLIAFLKGHQEMQISEYSKQKYELHLGILYFMRKNWQCDKIHEKFEEYERTECQKYRKYLAILYEYLCREYVGIPTVKPNFIVKQEIEIEGPIIYAIFCLAARLCKFFNQNFEPNLLNVERLNYEIKFENEQKLPINELILQLAIDTANDWQTNEILDGILRENFDKNLQEMLKNAEEMSKEENPSEPNKIIVGLKFYDLYTWTKDALFCEFVRLSERYNDQNFVHLLPVNFGIVYLMRKNWHCDKIGNEFQEKCQKYHKYLHIFYEFLFRLYVEDKNAELASHLPAVKPIFTCHHGNRISLIDVVKNMNENSKLFFNKNESALKFNKIKLQNEEELNYEIKEDKSGINPLKTENETKIAKFRKKFERKMESLYENAPQNSYFSADNFIFSFHFSFRIILSFFLIFNHFSIFVIFFIFFSVEFLF